MFLVYIWNVYVLMLVAELGFFGLSKVTKSQTYVSVNVENSGPPALNKQ